MPCDYVIVPDEFSPMRCGLPSAHIGPHLSDGAVEIVETLPCGHRVAIEPDGGEGACPCVHGPIDRVAFDGFKP